MDILQFFFDNDEKLVLEIGEECISALEKRRVDWNRGIAAAARGGYSNIVWWMHHYFAEARQEVDNAVKYTLSKGDIPMTEWLLSHGANWPHEDCRWGHSFSQNLAISGNLAALQWLNVKGKLLHATEALVKASEHGHTHVVRWLTSRDANKSVQSITTAAGAAVTSGNLHITTFLLAKVGSLMNSGQLRTRPIFSNNTMVKAAMNGHLDAVRWLYQEYGSNPEVDLFKRLDGNNPTANDLLERQGDLNITFAMDAAAKFGHLEVVKYLHDLQISMDASNRKRKRDGVRHLTSPECTTFAMDAAAANGHLNVVKWLYENRDEGCSADAMGGAAANGHIRIVQWLHQNTTAGCTTAAMDNAAMNGHLDIVKWLHKWRHF